MREKLIDQYGDFEVVRPEDFINTPLVSVVMSAYNNKKYLHESIESILKQTYHNFEFIIINDGSSDGSLDVLNKYQKDDNRISIVNQNNIGLTKSLNRGINLAKGKYIARQDADDISLPARFEKQLGFFENNPNYFLIGTAYNIIDQFGNTTEQLDVPLIIENHDIQNTINKFNPFFHSSVMFRNDITCLDYFYDPAYKYAQDYELWIRVLKHYKAHNLPEKLSLRRRWPGMIANKKMRLQRRYVLKLKQQLMSNSYLSVQFWYFLLKDLCVGYLPLCFTNTPKL